jgi:DNA-binding transcriptional LysR family regulator
MELHQVRYFLAVVKTLNFTKAAEHCNVTQPALTKGIQKLEQELGGELILRERQLTQLTDLGKTVLPMLERTLAAAEAVRTHALEYQRKEIAPLKIGIIPSISSNIIMEPLLEMDRVIPGLQVDTLEASAKELVDLLMSGDIGAAIVGNVDELPDRIDHWALFEERYVIITAPTHPLANLDVAPIDALRDAIFLERVGCDVASMIKASCFEKGQGPKVKHRSAQEGHLQQMVAAGFGIIFAPEHSPRLSSLSAIPVEGDPVRRSIHLLVMAGRPYSPALDAFVKIARVRDWSRTGIDDYRANFYGGAASGPHESAISHKVALQVR